MAFLTGAGGRGRARLPLALACCLGLMIGLGPVAGAHVGMRLRLGYRADPTLAALSRLAEIYLEASSGFSVDLKEFADAASLGRALREEQVDLAFEYPADAGAQVGGSAADETPEAVGERLKARFRERYGAVWVAEFRPPAGGRAGSGASCILSQGVAGDLAYYTLPSYLKKLLASLTRADLDEALGRDPTGSDRDLLRGLLARKRLI